MPLLPFLYLLLLHPVTSQTEESTKLINFLSTSCPGNTFDYPLYSPKNQQILFLPTTLGAAFPSGYVDTLSKVLDVYEDFITEHVAMGHSSVTETAVAPLFDGDHYYAGIQSTLSFGPTSSHTFTGPCAVSIHYCSVWVPLIHEALQAYYNVAGTKLCSFSKFGLIAATPDTFPGGGSGFATGNGFVAMWNSGATAAHIERSFGQGLIPHELGHTMLVNHNSACLLTQTNNPFGFAFLNENNNVPGMKESCYAYGSIHSVMGSGPLDRR